MGENDNERMLDAGRRADAFKLFCRTGNKSEVARQLEVSKTLVYRWSREDRWSERICTVKQQLSVFLHFKEELLKDTALRALAEDLSVLGGIQERAIDALVTKDLRPKTWGDFLKTMDFVLRHKQRILAFVQARKNDPNAAPPPVLLGTEDLAKHLSAAVIPNDCNGHGDGSTAAP